MKQISIALLGVLLLGASSDSAPATSPAEDWPDLDPSLLLSIDRHLLHADFIGVVSLDALTEEGPGHSKVLEFALKETWFSRWPSETSNIRVNVTEASHFGDVFKVGDRHIVLLSGGQWRISPFTFREHSVFHIRSDDTVECASGNQLYGLSSSGFVCSTSDYTPSKPLKVAAIRDQVISARAKAAARFPGLSAQLDSLRQPLQQHPSYEKEIDRTKPENQGGFR